MAYYFIGFNFNNFKATFLETPMKPIIFESKYNHIHLWSMIKNRRFLKYRFNSKWVKFAKTK